MDTIFLYFFLGQMGSRRFGPIESGVGNLKPANMARRIPGASCTRRAWVTRSHLGHGSPDHT